VVLTVHDPLPHSWILPRALRWVEVTLLSIGYSICDRLIVHNEAGKSILVNQFHNDSGTVTVIPHGPLNLARSGAHDPPRSVNAGPLRLLVFGSLRKNRGLHLSIAAVQRLQRVPIGRPVFLTIAGWVPNTMEDSYWERCRRTIKAEPSGIEVMEGSVDDAEIGPLFAAHDALLLP
jgi:glycosyltransferase involved in cell wall biosynthesis